MKIIEKLSNHIEEEIKDAACYAKMAIEYKTEYPALAETLYSLSVEEMGHMTSLHEEVVRIIDKYKKESSIWHKLTLRVEGDQDDRRSSHIRAQYSDRMRVNDIQYEIGDTMALIGTFSYSRKASRNDESRIIYFENI